MQMYPHKGAFPPMGASPNLASTNLPIVGENQWISQSAYQNIDLEKVDWAALAQQWIHMKETCSVDTNESMPNAPPPPRFSNPIPDYEEKGEAPMEVEHDDEPASQPNESTSVTLTAPPPPTNVFHTNNWNSEQGSRNQHQKQWNRSKLNQIKTLNCLLLIDALLIFQKGIVGIHQIQITQNHNACQTMAMHQVKYSTMLNHQMFG